MNLLCLYCVYKGLIYLASLANKTRMQMFDLVLIEITNILKFYKT